MPEKTPRMAPAPLASPRDVARILRRAVLVIGAAGISWPRGWPRAGRGCRTRG